MWGEREGDPKLIPPWTAAFFLKEMLLHPWERKTSAWRAHLMPASSTASVGCAHITRDGEDPNQKKAQADPKGPAWPRLQPNSSQNSKGCLEWVIKTHSSPVVLVLGWVTNCPLCPEILTSVSIRRIASRSFWICEITNILAEVQDFCVCMWYLFLYPEL